jgi:hypothetical protein
MPGSAEFQVLVQSKEGELIAKKECQWTLKLDALVFCEPSFDLIAGFHNWILNPSRFQISHCNPICKVDQEEVQGTTDCLEGFLGSCS